MFNTIKSESLNFWARTFSGPIWIWGKCHKLQSNQTYFAGCQIGCWKIWWNEKQTLKNSIKLKKETLKALVSLIMFRKLIFYFKSVFANVSGYNQICKLHHRITLKPLEWDLGMTLDLYTRLYIYRLYNLFYIFLLYCIYVCVVLDHPPENIL